MHSLKTTRSGKVGLAPGTLVHTGEQKIDKARIRLIDYDEKTLTEKEFITIEECFPFKEAPTVTWINIDGLHDLSIIEKIGAQFGIHPLSLEDVVSTGQRPKFDDSDAYLFLVLKMIYLIDPGQKLLTEQLSIITGSNFVITFQERVGDVFERLRERIRMGRPRLRKSGADYLTYCLMDSVVDNYFVVLDTLGDQLEDLEEEVLESPQTDTMEGIYSMKRKLISLRKSISPLRDVVSKLSKSESALISRDTDPYMNDLFDHTFHVMETIETYRETASSLLDTYMTGVSNRMNEVMKVLTIIATIFIPLTFIAGIYGMNFEWMPELKWVWAYPVIWCIMLIVTAFMLIFFRRKKWL